jgi:hypothetical protein
MKLSYAICVCSESRELQELLNFLTRVKDDEDEINILVDTSKVTDEVRNVLRAYDNLIINERVFDGDFSEHRNYHATKCSGDYIFAIDADEIPQETLVRNVKSIIQESGADLIFVPRINICPGYTQKWLDKHSFKVNNMGWINWPDYQGRIYKNTPILKWTKGVHEVVSGSTNSKGLEANPSLALWHIKSITRQDRQNAYYDTLI